MRTQSVLLAALAAAPSAFAHTVWSTFYVDGVSQVCIFSLTILRVLTMNRETVLLYG